MISILSKNKKSVIRWGIYLMLSCLAAVILELAFNSQNLRHPEASIEVSGSLQKKKDKLVYTAEFDDPTYIDKIRIEGKGLTDTSYTLVMETVNAFNCVSEKQVKDQIYSSFDSCYTRIGEKILSISIRISDAEKTEVSSIRLLNRLSWNKYRMTFIFLVGVLVCFILFEKTMIISHPEYFYAGAALGFGLFIIAAVGPKYTTWDEDVHYRHVYMLSSGSTVEWNLAAWKNYEKSLPSVNTRDELDLLKEYVNEQAYYWYGEEGNPLSLKQYNMVSYAPMVLFYSLGKWLKLSYAQVYALGRAGNLFFCVLVLFFAIKLAKKRKILITAVSLMPTVIFQCSTYTYDGLHYACLVMGFVLWMNEANSEKIKLRNVLIGIVFCVAGCLSKLIYIPVLLLYFTLPAEKYPVKKICWIFRGVVICACIAGLFFVAGPVFQNLAAGNMAYGGDSRGGDTGASAQLMSVMQHPLQAFRLLCSEIFRLDNFRNIGITSADQILMTNLLFLNFASLGSLEEKWSMLLMPLLILLFFVVPERQDGGRFRKNYRIVNGIIIGCITIFIWIAMYLSFTPVGSDYIDGVQARYYLPLLFPFAYVVWNEKFKVQIKERTYNRVALSGTLLLISQCVYQLLIQKVCL